MKRKQLIALAIITLISFGGCKELEFDQQSSAVEETVSEAVESTQSTESIEETKEEKVEETDTAEVTLESASEEKPEETKEEEASEKMGEIQNNGGFFVGLEDQIIFRAYDSGSFNSNIIGTTDFMNGSAGHSANKIMSVSKKDPTGAAETLVENDNGYGPLYLYGGYIYSGQIDDGFNESVYRISIKTGKAEKIADGFILGSSSDGRLLAIESNDFSTDKLKPTVSFYENGKELFTKDLSFPTISVHYIAMNEDSAFFYLFDENDQTSAIVQLTKDNKYFVLAEIPSIEDESMRPIIKKAEVNDEEVSFTLEMVAGSGNFVNDIREISVPICKDSKNTPEDNILYEANVGANLYNEEYSEETDYPDAIAELEIQFPEADESGFYRTIQKVEEVDGKTYAIVANSVINSIYAIGWRETYDLLGVEYYQYSEIEGLQKIASYPCMDGTISARAWVVGEKGKKADSILYQLCEIDGVETEPTYSEYFYNAKIAEDAVYEYPKDGDINGDWTKGDVKAFLENVDNASVFLSKVTKKNDVYGYAAPTIDDNERNYIYIHLGFNEKGEINYIRPVVFD